VHAEATLKYHYLWEEWEGEGINFTLEGVGGCQFLLAQICGQGNSNPLRSTA